MRGRRPSGPEYVDHLDGSAIAKERLKVILETLAGTCRVQEACARLGISEPRFHQLRTHILEAALAGSEPQTPGRKPRTLTPEKEQVRLLQQQLAQQDFELRLARAREEIALTLPRLVPDAAADDAGTSAVAAAASAVAASAAEKKTPSQRRRGRPPKYPGSANQASPPGKRKNT